MQLRPRKCRKSAENTEIRANTGIIDATSTATGIPGAIGITDVGRQVGTAIDIVLTGGVVAAASSSARCGFAHRSFERAGGRQ